MDHFAIVQENRDKTCRAVTAHINYYVVLVTYFPACHIKDIIHPCDKIVIQVPSVTISTQTNPFNSKYRFSGTLLKITRRHEWNTFEENIFFVRQSTFNKNVFFKHAPFHVYNFFKTMLLLGFKGFVTRTWNIKW